MNPEGSDQTGNALLVAHTIVGNLMSRLNYIGVVAILTMSLPKTILNKLLFPHHMKI